MKRIFKKLKEEKGLTGADVTIGLAILMLMVSLLTAFFINISNSTSEIRRNAAATKIITSIFEKIEYIQYDNNAIEIGNKYEDDIKNGLNIKIPSSYTVEMQVEKAEPSAEFLADLNIDAEEIKQIDIAKKITVSVSYQIKGRNEKIEMSMIKGREMISMPNKPVVDEENYIPVKYLNNAWVITTAEDPDWYNYENGDWPRVIGKSDIEEENEVGRAVKPEEIYGSGTTENDGREIFVWIPRFAYRAKTRELYFLIGNSNNYVIAKKETGLSNFSYNTSSDKELNVQLGNNFTDSSKDNLILPECFKDTGDESTGFWYNYTSTVYIEDTKNDLKTKIFNFFHDETNSILYYPTESITDNSSKVSKINGDASTRSTIKALKKYCKTESADNSGNYNF